MRIIIIDYYNVTKCLGASLDNGFQTHYVDVYIHATDMPRVSLNSKNILLYRYCADDGRPSSDEYLTIHK